MSRLAHSDPMPSVNLYTGGLFATRRPTEIRTLLGSCVAACLYDPRLRIGGMNHFSLPGGPEAGGFSTRYGANAMELLINELMKLGADRKRLAAKLFGGGRVIDLGSERFDIGERNQRFVLDFLAAEGIPAVAVRWGGEQPLRVRFETDSARALVRAVPSSSALRLARQEASYRAQILTQRARLTSDVTLFFE